MFQVLRENSALLGTRAVSSRALCEGGLRMTELLPTLPLQIPCGVCSAWPPSLPPLAKGPTKKSWWNGGSRWRGRRKAQEAEPTSTLFRGSSRWVSSAGTALALWEGPVSLGCCSSAPPCLWYPWLLGTGAPPVSTPPPSHGDRMLRVCFQCYRVQFCCNKIMVFSSFVKNFFNILFPNI